MNPFYPFFFFFFFGSSEFISRVLMVSRLQENSGDVDATGKGCRMHHIIWRSPIMLCVQLRLLWSFANKQHCQIMEETVPLEVRTLSRLSCYYFQYTNLFGFSELACSRNNLALVPRNRWLHQDWSIFGNFYGWLRWYFSLPKTGATCIKFIILRLIACFLGGDCSRVEERKLGRLQGSIVCSCLKADSRI